MHSGKKGMHLNDQGQLSSSGECKYINNEIKGKGITQLYIKSNLHHQIKLQRETVTVQQLLCRLSIFVYC